jgi:hypothetical protein
MVKIYIDNYDLTKLSKKIGMLKDFVLVKKTNKNIYSIDGLYLLENDILYQLEPSFKSNIEVKKIEKYTFIIDNTEVKKKEIESQLPLEYIICESQLNIYSSKESKLLSLVVETLGENVVGFYFECKNIGDVDFTNKFFIENINEFLCVLF